MPKHDQQNTPFKQNVKDLWKAIRGKPRDDGRGWFGAVGHEAKNVVKEVFRKWGWV